MENVTEGVQNGTEGTISERFGLNEHGERRIEPGVVTPVVKNFGHYYNVPEEQIEVALAVPVFIATPERIREMGGEAIMDEVNELYTLKPSDEAQLKEAGIDIPTAKQESLEQAQSHFESELNVINGFVVRKKGKATSIYFNADKSHGKGYHEYVDALREPLEHEFSHILSFREDGSHGFYHGPRDEQLDEAATQILVLSKNNPSLSPSEMFRKVKSGELSTQYPIPVARLLLLMSFTMPHSEPIDFQSLAAYYFQTDEDASLNKSLFLMEANSKAPEELRRVSNVLTNVLEGRESS